MKKLLLLLMLLLPINLWADKWTDPSSQLVYEYDSNGTTAIVIGGTSSSKVGTTINIPEKIAIEIEGNTKNFSVIAIGPNAFKGYKMTSVEMSNTITSIGESSFYGCTQLTEIKLSDNIVTIGKQAFYNCKVLVGIKIPNGIDIIDDKVFYDCQSLESIIIPESVKSIGASAFYRCKALRTLDLPVSIESIGNSSFYNCTGIENLTIRCLKIEVGSHALDNLENLKELTLYCENIGKWFNKTENISVINIEEGVMTIADKAFVGCSNLTTLSLPQTLKTIGDHAFENCSKMSSLIIPLGVTSIGKSAFRGCSGLEAITLGTGLSIIDDYTFYGCSSLKSFTIPQNITSIGGSSFLGCSELTSVDFPQNVSTVMGSAFKDCIKLETITVRNGSMSLGQGVFNGCDNLSTLVFHCEQVSTLFRANKYVKKVIFGDEVTTIDDEAFMSCRNLANLDFSKNLKSIGKKCFNSCTNLGPVVLPNSVQFIGEDAFGYSGLSSINIPDNNVTIGPSAFAECKNITSITIPYSILSIGKKAFIGCDNLAKVTFHCPEVKDWFNAENCGNYAVKEVILGDEVKAIGDKAFELCFSLASFVVPYGVPIGKEAFRGCKGLTRVTFHCTEIGDWFSGCPITEIIWGKEVKTIGNNAFYYCDKLVSVDIPEGIESIGDGAFHECYSLETVKIPNSVRNIGRIAFAHCRKMESFNIPSSITTIREGTFSNCFSITSIQIPDNITSIESEAFYNCKALKTITIGKNVKEIGEGAFCKLLRSNVGGDPEEIDSYVTEEMRLSSIESYIREPFQIPYTAFAYKQWTGDGDGYIYMFMEDVPLYIPAGTKDKYAMTREWCQFININEMIDENTITVTANNKTMVYGDELPQFTFKTENGTLTGTPQISCEATSKSAVGTYPIIISAGSVDNENVIYVNGTLTIEKAPLTIKAGTYRKKQGEENPEFTLTYEGFKNNETKDVLWKQPTVTCDATIESRPSEYEVKVYGAEAQNYEISYVNGWLIIEEVPEPQRETFIENGTEYEKLDNLTVAIIGDENASNKYIIPETVTHDGETLTVTGIAADAFKDNTKITEITIPGSVISISGGAFAGCTSLTTIIIYATEPIILTDYAARTRGEGGTSVFDGVDKEKCILYVPQGCVEKYRAAEGWKDFKIILEIGGTGISSLNVDDGHTFEIYNLQGRKVRSAATSFGGLQKGVYILNGRKVIK